MFSHWPLAMSHQWLGIGFLPQLSAVGKTDVHISVSYIDAHKSWSPISIHSWSHWPLTKHKNGQNLVKIQNFEKKIDVHMYQTILYILFYTSIMYETLCMYNKIMKMWSSCVFHLYSALCLQIEHSGSLTWI